jgi:uncharacterized protein DUF397
MTIATELIDAIWRKSSYSQGNGNCVEIAFLDTGAVAVRDSKDPNGPALLFTAAEWDAFSAGMADGEFVRR